VASFEDTDGDGTRDLYYYTQDHLGGTALTTDSSGTVVQLYDYYPYGSEHLNSQPTGVSAPSEHSFTDKELDDDLGLYYFEARWYNSTIGRFASIDPMDGVSYGYANNNPVVFNDPLGLESALVFYGEEYRDGADASAWQEKAESRADELRALENPDGSLVYDDGAYAVDGTTFENWNDALESYEDIGVIEYYGHGDKDGIYLRDAFTEGGQLRYETIFSDSFNGALDVYKDGSKDHYVGDLSLGNTRQDLEIKLWSCSTAESGSTSVAQSFASHFLAPTYASNSAGGTYFMGNNAFTSPFSSGGFDWSYPSWMDHLKSAL